MYNLDYFPDRIDSLVRQAHLEALIHFIAVRTTVARVQWLVRLDTRGVSRRSTAWLPRMHASAL